MEIFLSWSGEASREVAQAMRVFLRHLFKTRATTWFSPVDIAKGRRWNHELVEALQRCQVGIICATQANRESSWMMFEAGALARTIEKSSVFPYLVGVDPDELGGPLRQFQVTRASRSDTLALANNINALLRAPVPPRTLEGRFRDAWPALARRLTTLSRNASASEHGLRAALSDLKDRIHRLERLADFERMLLKEPEILALKRSAKVKRIKLE